MIRAMTRMALGLVVAVGCNSGAARRPDSQEQSPSSRLDGDRIVVVPSGETFRIPPSWLRQYDEAHNNLHLLPSELEAVRNATGEWDLEFAAVANAVIPFERCAAHVGSEDWGERGRRYSDLQARIYVGTSPPDSVRAAVLSNGRAAAESFFRPVSSSVGEFGSWAVTSLSWDAYYGDYGSRATVVFYATERRGRTAVVAFMFTSFQDHAAECDIILDSLSVR